MKKETGLIHVYCGDGKGKTTAAMGLALRAAWRGLNVVIVQFLKDGDSGEIHALRTFPNVTVFANTEEGTCAFVMNDEEKARCKALHEKNLSEAVALCRDGRCDVLVLDEVMAALNKGLLDEALIMEFLASRPEDVEVVTTGRNPPAFLLGMADYVSEIVKRRHPFDRGVAARAGVEM